MKAVIKLGGKQYIVAEKQTLLVDKLDDKADLKVKPLLVFDDKQVKVGKPTVSGASVQAKIVDQVKEAKVRIVKFQAKKRVNKMTGHRQPKTKIEITKISV